MMENKVPVVETNEHNEYKPSQALSAVFEWMSAAIVALVLVVLVFAVFVRMVNVDGQSMESTLHNGERLLISNFAYTPEYGDIVIIRRDDNTPLIKRVIGLPGDVIVIDNDKGVVLRNNEELVEPYTKTPNSTKQSAYSSGMSIAVVVGEDEIYVLGDNREHSLDSRALGPQPMDHLVGRVILRLSPDFGKVE